MKRRKKRSSQTKRLGRGLVGTAAATAALCAPAVGHALTYDEAIDGDITDLSPELQLDPSIDTVLGAPKGVSDNDYFSFTGLDPGASFTLSLSTGSGVGISIFDIINDSGVVVEEYILDPNDSLDVASAVWGSGRINLRFAGGEEVGNYAITHDAPAAIPEPTTGVLVGGGLAALGTRRRKRK